MIGRIATSAPRQRMTRPSHSRWYSSSARTKRSVKPTNKDLPPPLPPRKSPLPPPASKQKISPAEAKKEYIEARKKAGEFLRDPKAKIASLQADMDKTKEKLLKVHDKPIWRRIFDRFRAKQHAVINLLAASMAYILAHRLHLKMKANDELQRRVESETTKNSELRSLLRSLATEEFARDVVSRATTATEIATEIATETETSAVNDKTKKSGPSWFWSTKTGTSSSSSLPEEDALVASLRQKLEAAIGDDGLEDSDRKQKHIQDVWEENAERIENTNEGLAELAAALAAEESQTTTKNSKKRVFDM